MSNSAGIGMESPPGCAGCGNVAFVATAWGIAAVELEKFGDGELETVGYWPVAPFYGAKDDSDLKKLAIPGDGTLMNRLGPFGTGSSPTAFRVGDDLYLAITDGAATPMKLRVARVTRRSYDYGMSLVTFKESSELDHI